jgi:signal transduction histidine kinase
MVGYAEVLGYDYPSLEPEAVQAYLQTIAQNGRKMSNIIDALLLLAGVRQAGVKMEPLNMAAIVAETRQRLTPLFDDFQPKIVMPPDWPVAMGYAPWVEEIWVNYVSNGIKYGGAPPRLELGAMALPNNMVRFWVHDNGPGLSPDEQNRLFTPFTRLDPSRIKGYGLGLSIVRRIVERLGGHVQVESEDVPGKGSIFSFTLCAPTHPDFS